MSSDLIQAAVMDPAISAIRQQVGAWDDRIPFLLLPVRLETRFMEVDHPLVELPVPVGTPEVFIKDLGIMQETLRGLARLPLDVNEKPAKKDLYARLDKLKDDLLRQGQGLESYSRDAIHATPEQMAQMQKQWAGIQEAAQQVPKQLARLKSNYLREQYQATFAQVQEKTVARTQGLFNAVMLPKMKYLAGFTQKAAAEVHTQVSGVLKSLARVKTAETLRTPEAQTLLEKGVGALAAQTGGLVTGAPKDVAALVQTWETLDQNVKQSLLTLKKDRAALPELRRNVGVHLDRAARLKPRCFNNKDLTYSVQTLQSLERHIQVYARLLQAAKPGMEKRIAASLRLQLKKMSDHLSAALNRPLLIPAGQKTELLKQWSALKAPQGVERLGLAAGATMSEWQKGQDGYAALLRAVPTESDLDRGAAVLVPTKTVDELWVRIFPDDIFVHTHEPELTVEEMAAGKAYWREQWMNGGSLELGEGAWRLLCSKYSVQRAAWIVKVLTPILQRHTPGSKSEPEKVHAVVKDLEAIDQALSDASTLTPESVKGLGKRLKAAQAELAGVKRGGKALLGKLASVRANLQRRIQIVLEQGGKAKGETREALELLHQGTAAFGSKLDSIHVVDARIPDRDFFTWEFPEVATKKEVWVHAPHTYVLPDKFVVLTMVGNTFTHAIAGKPIADTLILGLNPQNFTNNTFGYDAEGNLIVDPSIRWMTDFAEAVKAGMGIVIPLAPGEKEKTFDKVLALGVKNLSAQDARRRVEKLLENHHYKSDGMEFIPVGTPTNNTDKRVAGFMSREDKDLGWKTECGDDLFNAAETDRAKLSDGQRLATALGIDPAVFQHVANSQGLEISQAQTLNRVLTPATLGFFLEEIVSPFIPRDAARRIKKYFSEQVIGRGSLPSLRVGTQPYGVLVTSAFSRFRMLPNEEGVVISEADKANPAVLEAKTQQLFEIRLRKFIRMLHEDWTRIMLPNVKCAQNTDPANPQSHFMNMLGLEAHSLINYFRYSVNSASRLDYSAGEPNNVNFNPEAYYSPYAFLGRMAQVLNLSDAEKVTLQSTLMSLPLYRMRYLEDHGDLKGERVVPTPSEDAAITGLNYIQWLRTKNPYDVWNHNQIPGSAPHALPSTSLLFLLLRHAWLLNYREAALNILHLEEGLITEEMRAKAGSPEYYRMAIPSLNRISFITKWSYLFKSLKEMDGLFEQPFDPNSVFYKASVTPQHNFSMAEYVQTPSLLTTPTRTFPKHAKWLNELHAAQADFKNAETIPTAKLERLLSEHLDTCSYRLDAWELGLANQRLTQQRSKPPVVPPPAGVTPPPQGLYLGAFGWVENLRADAERPLAKTIPAGLGKPADGPVRFDLENEGFVHAPSINHAMTAAILRSGYMANRKTADLRNPLAVNLTSERVRQALRMLEGVRQGVDVGALLGYQFERGLHERYVDHVELDEYVYPFRRNFPGTPAVDTSLESDPEQRQVVDGLAVLKRVRETLAAHGTVAPNATLYEALLANTALYPYGLADSKSTPPKPSLLPPVNTPECRAVLKEIDRMADTFDAMSDLMMAESVYQVAQGNQTRAAAVVGALAEGKNLPQPEIINTPRTGNQITQRLVVNIPAISGRGLSPQSGLSEAQRTQNLTLASAPHWESTPFSPRALAEPSLNRWLGTRLGDPAQIRCWVEYTSEGVLNTFPVTLKDLQLQPLDVVLLLGTSSALENASELNARIAYYVRKTRTLGLGVEITVKAQERSNHLLTSISETLTPEIKTFYEIAPLLRALAEFMSNSRPGAADDLILPEANNFPDRTGQDAEELKLRLSDLSNTAKQLITTWLNLYARTPSTTVYDATTLNNLKPEDYCFTESIFHENEVTADHAYVKSKLTEIRAFLFGAAGMSVPFAVPQSVSEDGLEQVKGLAKQGNDAFRVLLERWRKAQPLLAKQTISGCLEAAKELAGKNCICVPLCKVNNPAELQAAAALSPTWLTRATSAGTRFPMDAWLQGLAKSRKRMHTLENLKLLGQLFNQPLPELTPLQLPASEYWVGAKYPDTFKPERHTLSLVHLNLPADWTQAQCVLVLDEWTEVLPSTEELTGITFNYDQPDATAPQSLLLAVTPVETGRWVWDNLVYTLLDTLEMAKLRAVEPEHVDNTVFSQWLPAVMGEVVPVDMQSDTNVNPLGVQVVVDFAANNPPVTPTP